MEKVDEESVLKDLIQARYSCFGCPIACGNLSAARRGLFKGRRVDGPEYETVRTRFAEQVKPLEKKIDKTVDLFSRIKSTAQAEEVTTVLFAARKLKTSSRDESVSEKDIYDYILEWKKDWHREEKQIHRTESERRAEQS